MEPCKLCRLAVSCLEETIAHYIASLLTYTKAITDPFLKRMEADREQLLDFFEKSCAKERVRPLIRNRHNCSFRKLLNDLLP